VSAYPQSSVVIDSNPSASIITYGQTLGDSMLTEGLVASPAKVSTLAGDIFGYKYGIGTAAQFNFPRGLVVTPSGVIYVSDTSNNSIRKITPDGLVTTLAGDGIAGYVDGTGENSRFRGPTGIASDAVGNIYVADSGNHRIRKITPGGVVTTLAGNNTYHNGIVNGNGVVASFWNPTGVAVDSSGCIYVGDTYNHAIRKISTNGIVSTLAGGTLGYNDGSLGVARFSQPSGVAVDSIGNIYVADSINRRIRKITSAGNVITLAGNGFSDPVDGIGSKASFYGNAPFQIAVDMHGNVYVADWGNWRIRKVSADGTVTTLAGGNPGYSDGLATEASFSIPCGVAVDSQGKVFVADTGNSVIRKIDPKYSISGVWGWNIPSKILPAGTAEEVVKFTPTDIIKHNIMYASVPITVNKATPSIFLLPKATTITFGQSLSNSILNGGAANVTGSFAWTDPSALPEIGSTLCSVMFSPSDLANYNTIMTNTEVIVRLDEPSFNSAYPGKGLYEASPNGLTYLMNYAFGGSQTSTPDLPFLDTSVSNALGLVAIIRVNDASLIVYGEVVSKLSDYADPGAITLVQGTTNGISQSNLPAGCQRQMFIMDRDSNPNRFLRLKASLLR